MTTPRSSTSGAVLPAYNLRPGAQTDFAFARRLYLSSMKPLLSDLGAWDEETVEIDFRGYFDPAEINIVTMDGHDVGWLQVSHTQDELCIDQIHLIEDVRARGIGTDLITTIIATASEQGKNVSLSFVKGNRADTLYTRLGFLQVSQDATKIHKRRMAKRRKTGQ